MSKQAGNAATDLYRARAFVTVSAIEKLLPALHSRHGLHILPPVTRVHFLPREWTVTFILPGRSIKKNILFTMTAWLPWSRTAWMIKHDSDTATRPVNFVS